MRQGANSAVRFTTYATLKQLVQGTARPGQTLPSTITFAIGGIAGLVTVYTTMPLEYVDWPRFRFVITHLCFTFQCDQDSNADSRGAVTVPEFVPLCVSDLQGGGSITILDGDNPAAYTVGGKSILYNPHTRKI